MCNLKKKKQKQLVVQLTTNYRLISNRSATRLGKKEHPRESDGEKGGEGFSTLWKTAWANHATLYESCSSVENCKKQNKQK